MATRTKTDAPTNGKTGVPKTRAKAEPKTEAVADIREIQIPELEMVQAIMYVESISPLLMHAWSEKARKQLEDSQTGKAKQQREARDPDQEYRAACYVIPGKEGMPDWQPGKYGFPGTAFKHAFLYGVGQLDDKRIPKTKATGWLFPDDDIVPLRFSGITHRRDIGRNPVQPIYRPQFNDWECDLHVSINARTITIEQAVSIMDLGLFMGGIGDWRPSAPKNKTGSFGRARVVGVKVL